MSSASKIEWTNATWNPVRGCSIVSKGCTNCYAMKVAHRFSGAGKPYEGLTQMSKGGPVWTGKVRIVRELLGAPLHWKKPRRIFVNSMSDLFHEDVPDDFIRQVFGIMVLAPQHTFQILTKRPARMRELLNAGGYFTAETGFPPRNIWLGVSVEDQASANERIPLLLQTPATVRWISAEPLLGPISFEGCWVKYEDPRIHENWLERLHWVVTGGESGPGARPSHPDWHRSLRDQCAAVGVPFFFKQWGAWGPDWEGAARCRGCNYLKFDTAVRQDRCGRCGTRDWEPAAKPLDSLVCIGKKRAGRILDGRTHDEYPA